jgi:hypothetical protein
MLVHFVQKAWSAKKLKLEDKTQLTLGLSYEQKRNYNWKATRQQVKYIKLSSLSGLLKIQNVIENWKLKNMTENMQEPLSCISKARENVQDTKSPISWEK